ncbi:8544_t:CDS:1, partial [Scutellospora calospora]
GKIIHWLDEITQDNNNESKKQILEADKVKPELIEPKHPNQIYTRKSIDSNQISEGLRI